MTPGEAPGRSEGVGFINEYLALQQPGENKDRMIKDQVPCRRILGNIVVTLRIRALHTFKKTPGSL